MRLFSALLFLTLMTDASFAFSGTFDALEYRNVGPTRGGRVTAVAGTVLEPGTFYLGASGGGVWKTTDYGESWFNVSDGFFASPSVGDIAVSQTDANVLYVGTGSDGLRSNVIRGKGMYRSRDGGRSWTAIGLEETGHIGAVEIDPRSNSVVWVAAIGQAFEPNEERGVYRSLDGGQSWQRMLYVSDRVGFSDLELLPNNPDVVFATAWRAERKPWTIISGGEQEEGGLYKSEDGGENWRRITEGLPQGLIGKIDLAISAADSSIVYALVEAPGDEGGLYRSQDQGESFTLVSNKKEIRTRPFYYGNIDVDPTNPDVVYSMATDYYRSTDGGENWEELDPPHGDNHDMWINPERPELFIQGNDGGANITHNGGKTWSTQFNQPTNELYQVDVDDQYPYWLYAGMQDNWTTISVPSQAPFSVQSTDAWLMETGGCETGPAVPKPGNHNIVYANCKGRFGVFDKRSGRERQYYVGAANMYGRNPADLTHRFQRVSPVHVSPHNPDVVYHASQYVHRTTNDGVTWETISPDLTAFEADKQVISGSPITRDITGEEFYSTIYSLRESPVEAGVIWSGANDGPVHVTRDNGESWVDVTPRGLPKGGRVDSVEPSHHDAAVAYVAVHRYLLGDWQPYAYRTDNYGRSWKRIATGSNGIPEDHPVRVVREDPATPGLLYAGTEYGLYVSFNNGDDWVSFQQNLPVTPITDIRIHRDDLVLSTMGRGFWILDKASTALGQMTDGALPDSLALMRPASTIRYRSSVRGSGPELLDYPAPAALIDYVVPAGHSGPITLEILDVDGEVVNAYRSEAGSEDSSAIRESDMALNEERYLVKASLAAEPGLQRFHWDMRHRGPWHSNEKRRYTQGALAAPGTYTVRLTAGEAVQEAPLELRLDPRSLEVGVDEAAVQAQVDARLAIADMISEARQWAEDLSERDDDVAKAARAKLVTEEGTYMPPQLIDQMNYLYRMLGRADQQPGEDAMARMEQLRGELTEVLNSI